MGKSNKFSLSSLRNELHRELTDDLRESKIIESALTISFESHKGQTRQPPTAGKSPIPYIVHPIGVAKLTLKHWGEVELSDSLETVVAAALTHDVIEDSGIDFSDLSKRTSERCATIVLSLTKPSVTTNTTREERNKVFLDQIREAGATSVYIKLCDILHNLSRPAAMPLSLLDKTLRKASGPYMRLADGFKFKNHFDGLLEASIDSGMAILCNQKDHSLGFDPYDYSSFVMYQTTLAKSKILETHDIIAGLRRIPGVFFCSSMQHNLFVKSVFSKNGLQLSSSQTNKIESDLLSKNTCRIEPPLFSKSEVRSVSFSRLVTVPLFNNLLVHDTPFISLAIDDKESPGWLDEITLRPVVTFMSERLLVQRMNELNKLSEALRHFKLDLDPHVAHDLNISIAQLPKIKIILDAADYVRRTILLNIDSLLKTSGMVEDIDRVESRTKRAKASLIKTKTRQLSGIEHLDDIIGIRLVLLSRGSKKKLSSILIDWLTESDGPQANPFVIPKESIVIDEISSQKGYSATHIRFVVGPSGNVTGKLGCEIQLRTLFEDTWARISQAMAYKERLLSKSKTKQLLQDLADLRDASDSRFQRDLDKLAP